MMTHSMTRKYQYNKRAIKERTGTYLGLLVPGLKESTGTYLGFRRVLVPGLKESTGTYLGLLVPGLKESTGTWA